MLQVGTRLLLVARLVREPFELGTDSSEVVRLSNARAVVDVPRDDLEADLELLEEVRDFISRSVGARGESDDT